MYKIRVILLSLFLLVFSGCNGVYYSKNDSETLSRGSYATRDALVVSRVDLAKKYSEEVTRIVVPPKKPIKIEPLDKKTTKEDGTVVVERVVVLPESSPKDIVKVNSEEFAALIKNKEMLEKYVKGEEKWKEFSDEVSVKIQKDEENNLKKDNVIKKQESKIKSLIWYRNIVIGAITLVGLLIGLYVFSLLIKAGIAGARVVS